jgi:hypothetical protein
MPGTAARFTRLVALVNDYPEKSQSTPRTDSTHHAAVADTQKATTAPVTRRFAIALSYCADVALREGTSPVFMAAIQTQ